MSNVLVRKRSAWLAVLAGAVLVAGIVGAKAYALSGRGYFTGSSISVTLADDVIPGRPNAVPANTYSSKYTQAERKANYIAWLDKNVKQNAAGTGQTYTGGAFIVNTMLGRSSHTRTVTTAMWNDLKARINSPDIVITYETSKDANTACTAGKNCPISFYDPNKDDDFFATYNAGLGTIIEFKNSKGTLLYALEETCGNPVGGLPGLPTAPALLDGYKLDTTSGSTSGAAYKNLNVSVSTAGSTTANPFFFNSGAGNGDVIVAGKRTVSVAAPAASSGYKYIGYTICAAGSGCTSAYLNNKANIRGTGYNFSYTFVSGVTYHMRWLYEKSPIINNDNPPTNTFTLSCSQISGFAKDPDKAQSLSVDIYHGATKVGTVSTNAVTGAYTYDISSLVGSTSQSFSTLAHGVTSAGVLSGASGDTSAGPQSITCPSTPTTSCLSTTFSTNTMVVNVPFTFQVGVRLSSWLASYRRSVNPAMFVQVRDPSNNLILNSAAVPYSVTGSSPATLTSSPQITFTPTTPGTYKMQWGITGSGLDTSCQTGNVNWSNPNTNDAAYAPFFTTTGGDLMAGGDVTSWNLGSGSSYAGAGGQLAAIASGDITQFVTGVGLSGAGYNSFGDGTHLGFANTTAVPGNGIYGGGFAVSPYSPSISGQTDTLSGSVDLSTLSTNIYYANGSLQLYGTVPASQQVTIVVTSGDAFITGNTGYAYANTSQIPRLNLYVQNGDIVVRHDVSEIHGVFYASGNFVSCGNNAGSDMVMTTATAYNDCKTKLTVYGAVAADKLVLHRTYGSIVAAGAVPYTPAEEFIYSPEVWLAKGQTLTGSGNVKYDSYISLPPIL